MVEVEDDRARLTRLQGYALEALQLLDRARHGADAVMDVKLNDLVARARTRVLHVDRNIDRSVRLDTRRGKPRRRNIEACVAQSESEWEQRRSGVEQIAAMRAGLVVVEHRQLSYRTRERDRQMTARISITEQDVGHRRSALLTQIPALNQRIRLFRNIHDRWRTAV